VRALLLSGCMFTVLKRLSSVTLRNHHKYLQVSVFKCLLMFLPMLYVQQILRLHVVKGGELSKYASTTNAVRETPLKRVSVVFNTSGFTGIKSNDAHLFLHAGLKNK